MSKLIAIKIKHHFFKELITNLPNIPNIKPINKKIKTKIALPLVLACSIVVAIALVIVFPTSYYFKTHSIFIVESIPKSSETKRGDCDDWKLSAKAMCGPFQKQNVEITFYHNYFFENALKGEGTPISSMNKSQETILKLNRSISYCPKLFFTEYQNSVVFDHIDTFYNHVCGEMFSAEKRFTITDSIDVKDIPTSEDVNDSFLVIFYYITLEGKDASHLEYQYESEELKSLDYIKSYTATLNYKINEDGIYLYSNE